MWFELLSMGMIDEERIELYLIAAPYNHVLNDNDNFLSWDFINKSDLALLFE